MKKSLYLYSVILLMGAMLLPFNILAQAASAVPSETLWTTGKIFVVVIVAAIIFSGIGIFLVILERKITRLEKKISDKNL